MGSPEEAADAVMREITKLLKHPTLPQSYRVSSSVRTLARDAAKRALTDAADEVAEFGLKMTEKSTNRYTSDAWLRKRAEQIGKETDG